MSVVVGPSCGSVSDLRPRTGEGSHGVRRVSPESPENRSFKTLKLLFGYRRVTPNPVYWDTQEGPDHNTPTSDHGV